MKPRQKTSADRRFTALWLTAGLLEAPLLAVLTRLAPDFPVGAAAAAHAAAAVLLFYAPPKGKGWFSAERHWGLPMFLAAFFLPSVGWAFSGYLMYRKADAARGKGAIAQNEDLFEVGNPFAGMGTPAAIRRELADALDVLPAADALLSADPALKRGAIEALARIRSADSLGWILRARTDPDPEVRFFATSAITRLGHEYETAVQAAERECREHPGDLQLQLALYRVRYEQAVSGLLDPSNRRTLLLQCRESVAPSAERDTGAARLAYLVERALDPAGAFGALDRLERLDPERRLRWARERAELEFELGRFRKVRALLSERREEFLAAEDSEREWRSTVLWWTHA